VRELKGGGTDLRKNKRLPGRDTGSLKTDSEKLEFIHFVILIFIQSLACILKCPKLSFFGSKTIFET
jgi:hypothetical protein